MQFFADSVCRDEAVLDLRFSTMKRLLAPLSSARLHRGGETDEHHNENLAPPMTFEEAPRLVARATRGAPQWHTLR